MSALVPQPVTRGVALPMTDVSSGPVARPMPWAQQLSNDRCYAERRADLDPEQTLTNDAPICANPCATPSRRQSRRGTYA